MPLVSSAGTFPHALPQHLAASEGHRSTARLLLAASAHVNVTDRFGGAPQRNFTEMFRLTLQAGTPLLDAIREGHHEIADMLRAAGAKEGLVAGEAAPQQKVRACASRT